MLKRLLKILTVAVTFVCLVVCFIPVQAFAVDPVSALGLAGAMDAYGMAYGVGTVYDVSSSNGISDSFSGLWDDFSAYQTSQNDGYTTINGVTVSYDDYIDEWQDNYRALHGFSHSSGNFAAWSIDAESAEVFDKFWNWLLTGPAEMSRVDNQNFEFSSSQIGPDAVPIVVNTITLSQLGSLPLVPVHVGTSWNIYKSGSHGVATVTSISNGPVYAYGVSPGSDIIYLQLINFSNNAGSVSVRISDWDYSEYDRSFSISGDLYTSDGYTTVNGFHWVQAGQAYGFVSPSFSGYTGETIPAEFGVTANSIVVSASDTIGIKSYSDDGIVALPNPSSVDYVPQALDLVTSIPWDDTYDPEDDDNGVPVPWTPSAVPGVVDDIGSGILTDDYELVADDPEPAPPVTEVLLPFIPVGIPSFNFNFSGIWHYVREWVSSLGSWFSTLFSIWSVLPYAMVVPVYATAVVIIVLGVYKRFFM